MDRTKYQSWSQPLTHSISLKPDLGRSSNFLSVPGEGYFHLWNRYAEDFSNYNLNTWRVGEWTFESILGVGFAGLGRIDAKDRSNQPNLTFLVLNLYCRTHFCPIIRVSVSPNLPLPNRAIKCEIGSFGLVGRTTVAMQHRKVINSGNN